ncbi:Peroxisome biogenesis factor 1 [Armadillidium vulgare]|nr:Peroxisome biogenesis factor 1 [Armadillidium vulgare]
MNKGLIYSAYLKGNSFRHCFISFPHHWRAYISPATVPTFLVASETLSLVVSWAGHTHDQENEDEVYVYVSAKFLCANGFCDGELVMIRQLPCPSPCVSATTVVICDANWKELMLNIQEAQSAFLTQFRVIKKDQIFPLWLEGGVFILLKVTSFSPSTVFSLLQQNTEVKVLPSSGNDDIDAPVSLKPTIREIEEKGSNKTKEQLLLQLIYYIFILLGYSLSNLKLFPREELFMKLKIVTLPLNLYDCHLHILPKLLLMHPSLALIGRRNLRNTKYESSDHFIAKIDTYSSRKNIKTNENTAPVSCVVVVVVWEKIKNIRNKAYFRHIEDILQHKTCILSKNLYKKMAVDKDTIVAIETLETSFVNSKNFIIDVTVGDSTYLSDSVISSTLFSAFAELNQYCPIVINNKTILTLEFNTEYRDIFLCTRDGNPIIVKSLKDCPLYFHVDLRSWKKFPKDKYVNDKQNSSVSFSDNLVNEDIFKLLCSFAEKDMISQNPLSPNFILLQGSKGSGKTTLVNNLIKKFSIYPYFVYCEIISFKSMKGKKVDSVHKILKEAISKALIFKPSLLVLDDLDCIPNIESSQENGPLSYYVNHMAYMVRALLCQLIETQKIDARTTSPDASVTVVATCLSRNEVHPFLSSPKGNHIFLTSLRIPPFSEKDKLSFLKYDLESRHNTFISKRKHWPSCEIPPEKIFSFADENIISKLEGMTLPDIKNISLRIFIEAKERWLYDSYFVESSSFDNSSDYTYSYKNVDVEKAHKGYISSSMKGFGLQSKIGPKIKIGGLHKPRKMLEEMILWPSKYQKIFSQTSHKLRTGILLYGPPGCGKSLLAKSFERYHHINFIIVKGPELLSKYIGQSEKAVRDAFERATNAKPCILFFDEFESIAPRRGHDNTGVTDRVVNQLLTQMDGVEGLTGVFILAATSRPELIDPALLRPGRLDKGVYCPIPDCTEREEILNVLCEDINLDPEIDLKTIALKTEGYSGADLQNILSTALIKAAQSSVGKMLYEDISNQDFENSSVDESVDRNINSNNGTSPCITMDEISKALVEVRPSVGVKERLKYDELYKSFSQSKTTISFTKIIPGKRETLA